MQNGQILHGSLFTIKIEQGDAGKRIDAYLANHFSQYSRSFLQKLFVDNQVMINGLKEAKPSYKLRTDDTISIKFPDEKEKRNKKFFSEETTIKDSSNLTTTPSHDFQITVIAKNENFLIINKPAGLVVHAPNENYQNVTLSDWVIETHDEIAHVGLVDRPGIVHRLDKDTSGLMIIPRTNLAHSTITDMFKARKIHKTYLAIVVGHPPKSGTIDFLIGRHPTIRNKMHHFTETTKRSDSRISTTNYEVITYFKDYAFVKVQPITGRTHQIRVHFAAIGHPIFADFLYGKKSKLLRRHALHAHQLDFKYNDIAYNFTSPLEPDLQAILDSLEAI